MQLLRHKDKLWAATGSGLTWASVNLPADYANLTCDTATLIARDYFEGVFISTDASDSWQQIAGSSDNLLGFFFIRGNMIVAEKLGRNSTRRCCFRPADH